MNDSTLKIVKELIEKSKLTEDQKRVVEKYFFGSGRVVVDAGAGTGKTTTLIEILSNITLVEHRNNEKINPFERILVLSFGREASRQLKIKLKSRLNEIRKDETISISNDLFRWLETESFIQTIDSYLLKLLQEICLEISLNPLFDVALLMDTDEIVEEIEDYLKTESNYRDIVEELEEIYQEVYTGYFRLPGLFDMIRQVHQKSREFCWTREDYSKKMKKTISMLFSNYTPPFSIEQAKEIIINLTNENNEQKLNELDEDEILTLSKSLEHIYYEMRDRYDKFTLLLEKYDELYTEKTKKTGHLTYIDIAYMLWEYLEKNPTSPWVKSLNLKFDHILIDEFQDTSYVQCRIISHLIRNEDTIRTKNNIMIIGDVKQSIYQWRSAEPGIFSSIIEYAKTKNEIDLPFEIKNPEYVALVSNFRSQPDIIYLINSLFSEIFDSNVTGRIGKIKVDYVPLIPKRNTVKNKKETANIHTIFTQGPNNKQIYWADWDSKDAEAIVSCIKDILDQKIRLNIYEEEKDEIIERSPLPGDIALLFRRRSKIYPFLRLFDRYGINYSLILDNSLFAQHEVSLIVDFLDWFANPHNKYALLHILRSPLIAISDETLRFLASHNFMLRKALMEIENQPSKNIIKETDLIRLKALLKLRNDLRWDREGEKAVLIDKIINHGALDIVFLSSSSSSFETLANLRLLTEIIKEWEEEELLSYNEFVYKIKVLRDRAYAGKQDYSTIKIGDYESKNSVKIMTIHRSKGLEFPIVIIPDLLVKDVLRDPYRERIFLDREIGVAIKPIDINVEPIEDINGPGKRLIPGNLSSGIFWVSKKREDNGVFKFNNPLNQFIKKDIAEFWRLLYVATTRARDHLIFHLGLIEPKGNKYTKWMYTIQNKLGVLNNRDFNPEGDCFYVTLNWNEQNLVSDSLEEKEIVEEIKIEIIKPSPKEDQPLSFREKDYEKEVKRSKIKKLNTLANIQFVPISIAAKELYNLLFCPRRYAYAVLNKVDNYYLSGKFGEEHLPPGTTPPKGINSAAEWGDIVHLFMESFHKAINSEKKIDSELVSNILSKIQVDNAKQHLIQIINSYLKDKTISNLFNKRTSDFFTEYQLQAKFSYDDYKPVIITGTIDLLFKIEEEKWIIIDYKTGNPPNESSDLYTMYENQLTTYAWLLKQNYPNIKDIETLIVFVHPQFKVVKINYNLESFKSQVEDAIKNSIKIDVEQGFVKNPNKDDEYSRCITCPYSKIVGGPCEE